MHDARTAPNASRSRHLLLLFVMLLVPWPLAAADDYWDACNRHPELASTDFDGCFQPYLERYGFTSDYAQVQHPSTGAYYCQARKFIAYYRGTKESSGSNSNMAQIDILYYVYPDDATAQFQTMRASITESIDKADPAKVLYALSSDTAAGYLGPGGSLLQRQLCHAQGQCLCTGHHSCLLRR